MSLTDNFVFRCTGPDERPLNCAKLVGRLTGKLTAELAGEEAADAARHRGEAAADLGRSRSYRPWCAGAALKGRTCEANTCCVVAIAVVRATLSEGSSSLLPLSPWGADSLEASAWLDGPREADPSEVLCACVLWPRGEDPNKPVWPLRADPPEALGCTTPILAPGIATSPASDSVDKDNVAGEPWLPAVEGAAKGSIMNM